MNIVCAIEQEMKFMSDSEEGSPQYHKGYIRALEVIRDFLKLQYGEPYPPSASGPAVQRLMASLSLQLDLACEKPRRDLAKPNRFEQEALEIALNVLRSDTDYADFLGWWLQDYGRQVLSENPPPPLLPERSIEEENALAVEDAVAYVN